MGDLWADLAGAWGTATDLTMHEALDRWLDRMEVLYTHDHDHDQRPYRTRPIPTGLPALNRVVGGGLRCRGLTTLECEKLFQGDAVLATVARRIKTTVLLAGSHMADLTADVLVGEAQISPRDAARGTLTDEDWARISSAVGYLSDRHIRLTSVGTLAGLHSLIVDFPEVTSVLVLRAERFGRIDDTLMTLAELAEEYNVAILAATRPIRSSLSDIERLRRVGVVPAPGGRHYALLRLDRDVVSTRPIEIDQSGTWCR